MTNLEPSPSPPAKPAVNGRRIMLGLVLGAVLTPIVVCVVMLIWNELNPDCTEGGAEGSLACVMRMLAVIMLSIVPGALAGFLLAFFLGARRS